MDKDFDRRQFLSAIGKTTGLMAFASSSVASLFNDLEAATNRVANLPADQVATDEDFWFEIQQAFTVTRGITNLNNGGVSPSPRIVTESLVRYQWEQEDEELVNEVSAEPTTSAYLLATIYASLGESDRALDWLSEHVFNVTFRLLV